MQDALGDDMTCQPSDRRTASKTRDQARPVTGGYRDAGSEVLDERRGSAKRVRLTRRLNGIPVDGENAFCSKRSNAFERNVGQARQHIFF